MLTVISAIVRKDIGVWLRQPAAIAATILPSIVFFIIIYFSAQAVGRNPVTLVVQDDGPHARELAGVIQASDAFVVRRAAPAVAQSELDNLDVAAVITIPAGFEAAYGAHEPDPVTIRINNLNLDFTNDLRRSLPAAIAMYYARQSDSPIAVRVVETDLRPKDVDLTRFNLIPNLVLLLTIAGVVNSGLATAREWEDLTIKELLLAPISRASLIAGKLIAGWITTLAIGAVVLVLGAVTGYLSPSGFYWLPTLGMVALIALASAGLGVAVGAMTRRFQRVAPIGITVSFYLFFLSGGISVAAFLPDWVQTIARFVPTYYGVHALNLAVFYGSSDQLGRDVAVMAGASAMMVALGILALRRGTVEGD